MIGALRDLFDGAYRVEIADTAACRDEAFRIRYRVYCEEKGFEDVAAFPEGRERDVYDDRSVHAVVRAREGGDAIATVRLVLADPADPARPFPLEADCGHAFDAAGRIRAAGLPRRALAELSRFAVLPEVRRERSEPVVLAGLYRAILALSRAHRVEHWFAVMEPTLARLVARMGTPFEPLGGALLHRGRYRVPYVADVGPVLARLLAVRPDVWAVATGEGGGATTRASRASAR